jgi:putative membrane protein insertion efficiency factor
MKNEIMVKLIKSYQKNKQIIGVGHCKFYPTCSEYALRTYEKFNFFYATLLVGIRILRCNPLSKGGYDPVPDSKSKKKWVL